MKEVNEKPRVLFVCGRNLWRSPTAYRIYTNDQRIEVRSAGLSRKSHHHLTKKDIEWADLILVMEKKQKARILKEFRTLNLPPIDFLDIQDEFQFMDPDLIERIRVGTEIQLSERFGLQIRG